MILLLNSIEDSSSQKIIELCDFKGLDYFQIEDGHDVMFDNVQIENGILKDFTIINKTSKKHISKKLITGFFYRKGRISPNLFLDFHSHIKDTIKGDFINCLLDEWNALVFYIFDWIESNVPSIGSYNNIVPNKMKMLQIASESGFLIPDTFIFSNNKLLFLDPKRKSYVTKSIQDVLAFEFEDDIYRTYTSYFKQNKRINYYSTFPSLIQKKINSRYEIRVFYFDKYIYSSAIAHDKIRNEKVDYRNSETLPDIFPYLFTKTEEKKLRKFIQHSKYNSGSIDFLLSENNELFFLEINPVGQFDFVSDFCGKNIEIDIVKFFCSNKDFRRK